MIVLFYWYFDWQIYFSPTFSTSGLKMNPVITSQPQVVVIQQQNAEWQTDICDCFSDCGVCKWSCKCLTLCLFTKGRAKESGMYSAYRCYIFLQIPVINHKIPFLALPELQYMYLGSSVKFLLIHLFPLVFHLSEVRWNRVVIGQPSFEMCGQKNLLVGSLPFGDPEYI